MRLCILLEFERLQIWMALKKHKRGWLQNPSHPHLLTKTTSVVRTEKEKETTLLCFSQTMRFNLEKEKGKDTRAYCAMKSALGILFILIADQE